MIKKHVPNPIKNLIRWAISCVTWDQWFVRSWSQEGEDQILRRVFERQSMGFYVDIGAHHPKRFSNTFFFYRRGWRGINIDAMPGSMILFNRMRPRDTNLEMGIGEEESQLDYYIFNEPALNGFSEELSRERNNSNSTHQIQKIVKVRVRPLSAVLDHYLPKGQSVDFMSVDVEGLDLEVLKSNNWSKYRPRFVLVESVGSSLHEIKSSDLGKFLTDLGYVIYAKCINTVFFKEASK